MRAVIASAGFVLAALAATEARADKPAPDAAAFFEEGASAYSRGDYRAAALAFEEANRRVPSGSTLYNAAIAWEQARNPAQAADDFDAALADTALDERHQREARAHLATLERRLGRIDLTAEASVVVSIAHVTRARVPLRVHLLPGTYDLRAEYASGRSTTQAVSVEAQKVQAILLLGDEPPTKPAPSPPPKPLPAREASNEPAPPPPPPIDTARTVGWIALGTAGVGAATATIFGLVALNGKSDFDTSGATDRDAHDRAYTFRAAANVAWITTAACAVTAAVLLLVAPRGER
jgi:hypothetical protein